MGPWMVSINRGEDLVGIGGQVSDVDRRIVFVARPIACGHIGMGADVDHFLVPD